MEFDFKWFNFFRNLTRIWIPSWRFFDQKIDAPELLYQYWSEHGIKSDWLIAIDKPLARTIKQLFINPQDLEYFALHAALDRLSENIRDKKTNQSELEVSKKILINHIENQIKKHIQIKSDLKIDNLHFQFKFETDSIQYLSSPCLLKLK